jgi:hypothetical protein
VSAPLRPRPLQALRRVAGAPGLWLALCALQLAVAWSLAQPVAAAARAAMKNNLWAHPDRLLGALAELLSDHPAVAAALASAVVFSAVVGAGLALLVRGGVLRRLAGPCGPGEIARASLAHLPVLALIGVYGLVLRLVLVFVAHALAGSHALAELLALAALLSFATCTGDLASCRRVVGVERGVHPREYLRACLDVAHSPLLWLASAALTLARWAVAGAIVLVAVHGLGAAWSPWAARGLACLAVLLALWRAAVVVEAEGARPD